MYKTKMVKIDSVLRKKQSKVDYFNEKSSVFSGIILACQSVCGGTRPKEMGKITKETVSSVMSTLHYCLVSIMTVTGKMVRVIWSGQTNNTVRIMVRQRSRLGLTGGL